MQKFGFVVLGFVFLASQGCDTPTTSKTSPVLENQRPGEALTETSTTQQKESVPEIFVVEEKSSPGPEIYVVAAHPGADGVLVCPNRPRLQIKLVAPGEGSVTVEIAKDALPRPGARYSRKNTFVACDKTETLPLHLARYELVSNGSS